MSLIWDARSASVDDQPDVTMDLNVTSVNVTVDTMVPQVNLDVPNSTSTVQVEVPGVQGPAGLQNVFIQADDPSKDEFGNTIWGPAQTNFIWIPL